MTAIVVFAALVAASVAYAVYDGRQTRTNRQMDDYYRVEYRKSHTLRSEQYSPSSLN